MTRGKKTCKILKEIRRQIAENNDIEYITSECNFQGECKGTCPKCESEVRYLENELNKRRQLGKVVSIAGISLGVAGSFSACNNPQQENIPISKQQDTVEIVKQDTASDSPLIENTPLMGTIVEVIPATAVPGMLEIEIDTFNNADIFGFVSGEFAPQFPGGEIALFEFLKENIVYPEDAREKGIEGKVLVGFVVETDGSITNVELLRSKHPSLDKEAIRVVKMMPKWKSGELNGKIVRTQMRMPINFVLEK